MCLLARYNISKEVLTAEFERDCTLQLLLINYL
ncbi:hypothetical protein theurythT_11080 [Thalassotalea eurytherma]|uniref:Uncharacterized protein n=1 Tax=Thalassotalea eurytherma TaxID=1144278 RepID=A0ABQ6H0D1_9GAMM|nr:hypothetical protein theurythT_11080 [Thalassotalea eurytherma]